MAYRGISVAVYADTDQIRILQGEVDIIQTESYKFLNFLE